jgi:hypothetical protein
LVPSTEVASAILKVGAESSSLIVTVASSGLPIVAVLLVLKSVIITVSFPSKIASSSTPTSMVAVLVFAGIITVVPIAS